MTMTGAPPDLSLEQRMTALERANVIREQRAQLKTDLKHGYRSVGDLLMVPPAWLATMHVRDLLLAAPGLGQVKVDRALSRCRVSPSKTIGGLSRRQRDDLVSYLRKG